jgi:hypothetical protein
MTPREESVSDAAHLTAAADVVATNSSRWYTNIHV